ncbi:prepilin peptidase [Phytobacter sp. V91]|uniref:prepilin peptidase n=1 Tax=Phytobacter sp. V91 TaxID=3369425 RepID=UPI003F5E0166
MLFFLTAYLLLNGMLIWQDLRYGLLPDRLTCPLLWFGLAYACINDVDLLAHKVWGAIAGYTGFAAIYWSYRLVRGREGLGYGDVKFLAALGAWHGWEALSMLVFIAALSACIVVFVCLFTAKWRQIQQNPLPFGPFLAGAGLITGYQDLFSELINFQL